MPVWKCLVRVGDYIAMFSWSIAFQFSNYYMYMLMNYSHFRRLISAFPNSMIVQSTRANYRPERILHLLPKEVYPSISRIKFWLQSDNISPCPLFAVLSIFQ